MDQRLVLETELRIILTVQEGINTTFAGRYANAIVKSIPNGTLENKKSLRNELKSLSNALLLLSEQQ